MENVIEGFNVMIVKRFKNAWMVDSYEPALAAVCYTRGKKVIQEHAN